ncbi:hypothetical protein HDV05_002232 [Chytridiales sp. JEL 0842]|nr:hypothetical protein HDV05_002232 [Chytridiales sp. JEL 0842]
MLLGSIDQGTSSTRFIVFNEKGEIISKAQTEFDQVLEKPGWCEHKPSTLFGTVQTCMLEVAEDLMKKGINLKTEMKAIGITNQRETTVVWDRANGEGVCNAVVWLDTRTKSTVKDLVAKTPTQKPDFYKSKTGLPLSTYFSGLKLKWLIDNKEEVKQCNDEGNLMFGTVDSWLIYKLTGGVDGGVHVTDVSNASRTMMMNLETLQWDPEMIKVFGAEKVNLPNIRSSAEVYGYVKDGPFKGVPISGCLGDQQAALVGQQCLHPGDVKNTYGTGCFMLFNTGNKPVFSKGGLLTTVGYQLGKGAEVVYALEGSVATAGSAVKWLRDNLGIIKNAAEINDLASEVTDTGGVYFVPAFSGLYAPYWRDDARGCIVGLTSYSNKSHICRATLEAVCWQSKEILQLMNDESGVVLNALKVDGGLSNSDLAMQIQADLVGIPVVRPAMTETTALGAALAAGLGVGVWKNLNDFKPSGGTSRFESQIESSEREERYAGWKKAIERSFGWV